MLMSVFPALVVQIKMLSERKQELERRVNVMLEENEQLQHTVDDLRERTLVLEKQCHEKDLQVSGRHAADSLVLLSWFSVNIWTLTRKNHGKQNCTVYRYWKWISIHVINNLKDLCFKYEGKNIFSLKTNLHIFCLSKCTVLYIVNIFLLQQPKNNNTFLDIFKNIKIMAKIY